MVKTLCFEGNQSPPRPYTRRDQSDGMVLFEQADDLWPKTKKFRRGITSELSSEKNEAAIAGDQTSAASAILLKRDCACLERLVKIMETK